MGVAFGGTSSKQEVVLLSMTISFFFDSQRAGNGIVLSILHFFASQDWK